MRCDLHVHSLRSGDADLPVLRHFGRECYSEPRAVYDLALRRGMDLVTLTDHDTIEGALEIASLPNTFVSEEVSLSLPGGRVLHVGALDITERQHDRIASLRTDAEAVFAYCAEQKIPACLNHLFSALTGDRATSDFPLALTGGLSLIEGRNGMMNARINDYAMRAGRDAGLVPVGGSDAHTLASVASAYTVVEGARTRGQFLEGLRKGFTIPAGGHGSYAKLTRDVALVFAAGYRENALAAFGGAAAWARFATLLLALPILPLIPVVTAFIYANETLFAERHYRRFRSRHETAAWARKPMGTWEGGAGASAAVRP
ncbi:MAG TPA: PHP-associated domain-containing protein [Vicinamibacteria bacterium]|jgi:predicted metal-dependent phosphoesterase TrpH|nr:PHP-associated domain-containing protein [Vicinamibacteria bacterium]